LSLEKKDRRIEDEWTLAHTRTGIEDTTTLFRCTLHL
jgi:hypothetical protein